MEAATDSAVVAAMVAAATVVVTERCSWATTSDVSTCAKE